MNHYFIDDPLMPVNQKEMTFWFLGVRETAITDDGLFSKDTLDFGSRLLAETVIASPACTGQILDLGCGWGAIGLLIKKYHPETAVTLADVNQRAVNAAAVNSQRWQQDNLTVVTDGFDKLTDCQYDCIVSNPPVRTGKSVIYPLLDAAIEHLKPRGSLFFVMRKAQGAESAIAHLRTTAAVSLVQRQRGYWIIEAVHQQA